MSKSGACSGITPLLRNSGGDVESGTFLLALVGEVDSGFLLGVRIREVLMETDFPDKE